MLFLYIIFNWLLAGFITAAFGIVYIFLAVWWALIDEGYYVMACIWPINIGFLICMAYAHYTG